MISVKSKAEIIKNPHSIQVFVNAENSTYDCEALRHINLNYDIM